MAARLARWTAFAVPLVYLAIIAAVLVHEVVGHGMTALVTGGTFTRFQLFPDGGGLAWTTSPSAGARVAVLAGGIVSGMVFGALLLVLARLRSLGTRTRFVLVLLAIAMLHDALPYGLWGAILVSGNADVTEIIAELGTRAPKPWMVAGFAILYLAAVVATTAELLRLVGDALGTRSRAVGLAIAGLMTVGVAVGYAAFDWDSLVPGAGLGPTLLAVGLQSVTGVTLVLVRRPAETPSAVPAPGAGSLALAWLAGGATLAWVLLQARHGVDLA